MTSSDGTTLFRETPRHGEIFAALSNFLLSSNETFPVLVHIFFVVYQCLLAFYRRKKQLQLHYWWNETNSTVSDAAMMKITYDVIIIAYSNALVFARILRQINKLILYQQKKLQSELHNRFRRHRKASVSLSNKRQTFDSYKFSINHQTILDFWACCCRVEPVFNTETHI